MTSLCCVVVKLISIGRQRGYLVYDEVNDILPEEISTSVEEIEELYDRLGEHGIELVDSEEQWKERVAANEAKKALTAKEEANKLDLTPGTLEKTNDPVRMYLREMGTLPLLTREGEVAIARRIERGEKRVLKALSRNRWVITEILAAPERIKKERRALEELLRAVLLGLAARVEELQVEPRRVDVGASEQEVHHGGDHVFPVVPERHPSLE